jgi:hypothetical protein
VDKLTLPRLELPGGACVEFNDPEQLRGRDIDRFRAAWQGAPSAGNATNEVMQAAAELLIAAWDLPNLPNFPVPADQPPMWGELPWRTKRAIEEHLVPVVFEIIGLPLPPALAAKRAATAAVEAVDPPPPASE